MKTYLLPILLLLPLSAQVYTPPKSQPAPSRTNTSSTTPPSQKQGSSPLGNEIGIFNPSTETISWNGSTWAAGDNRLFNARLEKYLNEPADDSVAAQRYRETIQQILQTLSPHRKGGPQFADAVALLPLASAYPGDANLCDSLSNAIYTAVLSNRNTQQSRALVKAIEQEKQRQISDADWLARIEEKPTLGKTSSADEDEEGGSSPPPSEPAPGVGVQSLRYAEHLRRISEIEATKKTRELETKVKTELAKIQYQALMVQFFLQRRFEHVIMASRFYNQIWKDGDGALYLEEDSDLKELFSKSIGISPTVSTLDSLANEAIRDIDKGVAAFKYLVERSELESASQRLAEAYLIGEFMPAITTLPRETKRTVLTFVRGSHALIDAISAKDYRQAAQQVRELEDSAKDFDATKARAAIATYTRASDMAIMMAKNHLVAKDVQSAQAEIQKAMEIWPQNPKLAEFDRLVEAGSGSLDLRNDFDRLFSEQNYREVFKRQHELAPSIADDPARQDQFRQVLANLQKIETAVQGAKRLSRIDQNYAAWEELSEVHTLFPDDPVLNQEMTKLAPTVADFTIAVSKAQTHLEKRNFGSALSWFYKAKHLHPASRNAEQGIDQALSEIQ